MSISPQGKEMLQRFSQYVFRREAAEIREDLYESIVEMTLYLSSHPLEKPTVKSELERQLKLKLNQLTVDSAVEALLRKGFAKQKDGFVSLSTEKRKSMDQKTREQRKLVNDVENWFLTDLRGRLKKLDTKQKRTAINYLYTFLSRLFCSEGKLVLAIMQGSTEDVEYLREYQPPKRILQDLLVNISNDKLKQAIRESTINIFRRDETITLLNSAARNYVYFELLNIDPQCRLFQNQLFSEKTLLLDTNFIMHLLLVSEPGHEGVVKCAGLSKQLGVQLRFTKRTREEYLDQLEQANDRYGKIGITRIDTLSTLNDDFISSYAVEKKSNPKLGWNDFYQRSRRLETDLRNYGVSEYRVALPRYEVCREGLEEPVNNSVLKCSMTLTGSIKSRRVTEHDTYHLLLIRKLREAESAGPLGPRVWFLTLDSTLLCVDKAINELTESSRDLPSSIEAWAWTELIVPYLAPDISAESSVKCFSDFMKTSLSILPDRIDTKKLVAVQTPQVNFDLFSPEEVKEILSDEFVEEYWKRLSRTEKARTPTAIEHQKQLQHRVEDIAKDILMKKMRTEITMRYFAGIMTIPSLIVLSYCAINGQYIGTIVLGIITIALFAFAIGYSRLELKFRKTGAKIVK